LRRLDWDDPYTTSGAGHMTQLSIAGDLAFVANSFSGVTTYRVTSDSTLELLSRSSTPTRRCTTVASHAPSHTVYCAAPDPSGGGPVGRVFAYDVTDPRAARQRPGGQFTTNAGAIGDLRVNDDALFASAGPGGLLRAEIHSDGMLSAWRQLYAGDAFSADVDGRTAVVLDRDRGLVALDADTGVERATWPLDGPALSVRVVGDRVSVALGSEGVRVLTLGADSFSEWADLRPRCVADATDIDGDRVAVGCITGVYVYDVGARPARLFGFEPARGGVRDVGFVDRDLVVADFSRLSRLAVDDAGETLLLDATWNAPYDSTGVAHIRLRNEGEVDRDVELRVDARGFDDLPVLRRVRVAAGETLELAIAESELAPWISETSTSVQLRVTPAEMPRMRAAGLVTPAQQIAADVRLLRAAPTGRPRIRPGDMLPSLGLADDLGESVTWRAGAARLIAYQPDCALMWPELRELAWQSRHGGPAHPPTPVASFYDPRLVRYLRLEVFRPLVFGEGAVIAPDGTREALGYDLYDQLLAFEGSRNGAHWPTDYVVDADGRVVRIEIAYRGRWPL